MSKKILVIDDDESILDAVSLILEEEGYSVETAYKAAEAFKRIDRFRPDLIFLDILMSGSDGRDICKELKKNESTKKIPIIMTSAHPTAKEGALQCGAEDFLPKPYDTKDLLKMVKHYTK